MNRPSALAQGAGFILLLCLPAAYAEPDFSVAKRAAVAFDEIVIARPLGTLRVGESFSFTARWMGIPVGEGSIAVTERVPLDGRQAFHIICTARTNEFLSQFYPVRDVLHSYVDTETLRTLRYEKYQREGRYRADEIVTFDFAQHVAHYQSLTNGSVKTVPIPPDIADPIASFYRLRLAPIVPHTSIHLDVYSDEKHYRMEVKILEALRLELLRRGVFDCLLVEPVATFKGILVNRGRVHVYVTADAQRIPLLVNLYTPWGRITATISRPSLQQHLP